MVTWVLSALLLLFILICTVRAAYYLVRWLFGDLYRKFTWSRAAYLEEFVKNRYLVKISICGLFISLATVMVTFLNGYHYLLGMAIVWTIVSSTSFYCLKNVLNNARDELVKTRLIFQR